MFTRLARQASQGIIAVTPNPAIDRTLRLAQELRPQRLNRAVSVSESAGGKGINLARCVRAFGGSPNVLGFAGGLNGEKLRRFLEAEGLLHHLVAIAGETRECHILIDGSGHPTEINDPGPPVEWQPWEELIRQVPKEGQPTLSGSVPPGLEEGELRRVLRALPCPPVVDASGVLLRLAAEEGVALIAPNERELRGLMSALESREIRGPGQEPATEEPEPESRHSLELARRAWATFAVPILLTMGKGGAALLAGRSFRAVSTPVSGGNPIGSGDALLGAFLWSLGNGASEEEALRLGVAAGAVNAAGQGGGRIEVAAVKRHAERVRVERIG